MKKSALSRFLLGAGAVLLAALSLTAGCGSDSSATATLPHTPTPAVQSRVATPPPTTTAIPRA
ncbi:MAG: hypothetical protein U0802_07815 [Candidatus Binatia bacterium]